MSEAIAGMSDEEREAEIRQAWIRNAEGWSRAISEQRIESRRDATDTAIVDAVLAQRPGRVLDVGCGEGWLSRALAKEGLEVVGFDGSSALIEDARSAGGADFLTLTYDAFVDRPTAVGGRFDVAVCNFSLLGRNVGPLLSACASVLDGGGRLVIQTVHPFDHGEAESYADGWRREDFRGIGEGFHSSMPWYFRTFSSWVAELRGAGLALIDVREPHLPGRARPASIILVAEPTGEATR